MSLFEATYAILT